MTPSNRVAGAGQPPLPLRFPPGDIAERRAPGRTDVLLNSRPVPRVELVDGKWRLRNIGAAHVAFHPSESAALAAARRIARLLAAGTTSGRRLKA